MSQGSKAQTLAGHDECCLKKLTFENDYGTVAAPAGRDGRGRAIYTLGGDRETFTFLDPTQWLNVDSDVWRYSLRKRCGRRAIQHPSEPVHAAGASHSRRRGALDEDVRETMIREKRASGETVHFLFCSAMEVLGEHDRIAAESYCNPF